MLRGKGIEQNLGGLYCPFQGAGVDGGGVIVLVAEALGEFAGLGLAEFGEFVVAMSLHPARHIPRGLGMANHQELQKCGHRLV